MWLLVAGCAIPYVPYRTIYEDPVNYVRLEEDDAVLPEWPPGHHAHPKAFTADQMTRLLNGMTVKEHRIWLQKLFQGEAPMRRWRCWLRNWPMPSLPRHTTNGSPFI
jgi:hypothetical protein